MTFLAWAPFAHASKMVDRVMAGSSSTGTDPGLFNQPRGVAINNNGAGAADAGDVYVVDGNNNRVEVFAADGSLAFTFGTAGGLGGQFNSPQGIAIDQTDGSVYVSESGNRRIQKFSADGTFERAFGWDVDGVNPSAGYEVCTTAVDCKAAAAAGADGGRFAATVGHLTVHPTTGNLFVADSTNRRVQEFEPDGDWVRAFGWDVVQPGGTGEVVQAPVNEEQTVVLPPTFIGPVVSGTFTLTFSGQTTDPIAYNASAGALQTALEGLSNIDPGDVSVTGPSLPAGPLTVEFTGALSGTDVPQMTGTNINLVDMFGLGGSVSIATTVPGGSAPGFEICTVAGECKAGANSLPANADGAFAVSNPVHIAVGPDGTLYASDSAASNRVQRFDTGESAPGDLLLSSLAVTTITGTASATTTGLAVTGGGSLLVSRSAAIGTLEFSTPAASAAHTDTHIAGTGLTANAIASAHVSGDLYFTSQTSGHRLLAADDDGAAASVVTVEEAEDVTADSATLHAEIVPTAPGVPVDYRFQISDDGTDWTNLANYQVAYNGTGSAATPIPVSQPATGLEAFTEYHVRLLTRKGYGNPTDIPSASETFTTAAIPPTVKTHKPQSYTDTTARLMGEINPNNQESDYHFEYGTGPGDMQSAPAPAASITGGTSQLVIEQVESLTPNTPYTVRLCATNDAGTVCGDDLTFTTRHPQAQPEGRAYELVSPSYKPAGLGAGQTYEGLGNFVLSGFAAYSGERFAVLGHYGSTLVDDGPSFVANYVFAERAPGEGGWVSRNPLTHPLVDREVTRMPGIGTATPGLARIHWISNGRIPIFEEQPVTVGQAYFGDWQGRWELLSPTAHGQQAAPEYPDLAFAADGSRAMMSGDVFGLAGPDAPDHPDLGQRINGRSVYLVDTSNPPADTFAGTGERPLANTCTGMGAERTLIPSRAASGKLEAGACPEPSGGAAERLISPYGATAIEFAGNNLIDRADPGKNAISADGTRAFFMAPDPNVGTAGGASGNPGALVCNADTGPDDTKCPPQLYVRQVDPDGSNPVVRWISHAEAGLLGQQDATLTGQVFYEGASVDGSRVFFRTPSPLTADDPNGTGAQEPGGVKTGTRSLNSWDLYRYDFPTDPDEDIGNGSLTRISGGPDGSADCNNQQGSSSAGAPVPSARSTTLRYASEDGLRAYFVCSEPLPGVPVPANGTITEPGSFPGNFPNQTNLYFYDETLPPAERYRFIARLPRVTALSSVPSSLGGCASTGGYEMQPMFPGQARDSAQLRTNCFRGSRDARFVTFFTSGRLTADDPDGESGDLYAYDAATDELTRISAPDPDALGAPYVCIAPGSPNAPPGGAQCYGDGGFDIDSPAPLSIANVIADPADPADRIVYFQSRSRLTADDEDDLYDVYEWRNGALSLISAGTEDHALLKGHSSDGKNVYLVTRERLSWQDVDAVADIYTARVGGGIPEPEPPALCAVLADACQVQVSTPVASTVRSSDATSSGNVSGAPDRADRKLARCLRLGRGAKRAVRKARVLNRRASRAEGSRARKIRRRAIATRRQAIKSRRQARRCRAHVARAANFDRRTAR